MPSSRAAVHAVKRQSQKGCHTHCKLLNPKAHKPRTSHAAETVQLWPFDCRRADESPLSRRAEREEGIGERPCHKSHSSRCFVSRLPDKLFNAEEVVFGVRACQAAHPSRGKPRPKQPPCGRGFLLFNLFRRASYFLLVDASAVY
jgi:hypothetical protein